MPNCEKELLWFQHKAQIFCTWFSVKKKTKDVHGCTKLSFRALYESFLSLLKVLSFRCLLKAKAGKKRG